MTLLLSEAQFKKIRNFNMIPIKIPVIIFFLFWELKDDTKAHMAKSMSLSWHILRKKEVKKASVIPDVKNTVKV